jgi:hypothetical protein
LDHQVADVLAREKLLGVAKANICKGDEKVPAFLLRLINPHVLLHMCAIFYHLLASSIDLRSGS